MKNFLIALGLTVILSSFCGGQTNHKAKLIVSCTTKDTLGQTICSKLRDAIAKSPRFVEVEDTPENRTATVQINIVTIAVVGDAGDPTMSAMGVAYTLGTVYLTQSIEKCGRDRVSYCVDGVMADLDEDDVKWAMRYAK